MKRKYKKFEDIWVYVLKLEENKFYVGKSSSSHWANRCSEHFNSKGAKFTKLYKPEKLIELYLVDSDYDAHELELDLTLLYLKLYNTSDVRGSICCSTDNSPEYQSQLNWIVSHMKYRLKYPKFEKLSNLLNGIILPTEVSKLSSSIMRKCNSCKNYLKIKSILFQLE